MAQKIVINGQTYVGVDTMPPDVRDQYETALRLAGVPAQTKIVQHQFIALVSGQIVSSPSDLPPDLRGQLEQLTSGTGSRGVHTAITVNGAQYASPEEMPADVRAQYDRALALLSSNSPAGKVEAAAMRQLLRAGSSQGESSGIWRAVGWLIIGGLALFYVLTHWHHY